MASNPNPYEPPLQVDEVDDQSHETGNPPFRSPRLLGTCTCLGLALNIAVATAALSFQFGFGDRVGESQGEVIELVDERPALAMWTAGADAALQLLRILTGFLFVAWMYRVHCNLLALGHEDLDWKPLAGLVMWFIPIVGLILPCLVMREIVWRSSPQAETLGRENRSLVVVNWWWVLFLVGPLSFVLQMMYPDTFASLPSETAFRFNVTLYLSVIVSGFLAAWLVFDVNRQQQQRLQILQDQRIRGLPHQAND